jgi:hypothetical protein
LIVQTTKGRLAMKLIRFVSETSVSPEFGVVVRDHAVSFSALQRTSGRPHPELADSGSYLANLPASEQAAKEPLAWGEEHLEELGTADCFPLGAVRLFEPVGVAALFDFGLTPRNLRNSADTMLKYEKDHPQTAPLLQAFAKAVMQEPASRPVGQPEHLAYYKGNLNIIVGDGELVPSPAYTSRLDIEPDSLSFTAMTNSLLRASASSTMSRLATFKPWSTSAASA